MGKFANCINLDLYLSLPDECLRCNVSNIKMLAYCKAALQVLSWQIDGRPKGPRLVWKLSDVSGVGGETPGESKVDAGAQEKALPGSGWQVCQMGQ